MDRLTYLLLIISIISAAIAQKIAPGVPPQQYQQQVPQMQYTQPGNVPQMHHQPTQHIQPPIHQQPVHQQPPPQMHHQQPVHQQTQPAGTHPEHRPHQNVLDTSNIQGEKAHIQEHIDVPIDTSKMSEQELQFHYFKMHDSDHNNKLDGCELIKSLIHWHEKSKDGAHGHSGGEAHQEKIFTDEELIALIDPILAMDDTGHDGFIDYPEFIKAQQKAAAQAKAEAPH